jgi:hypothetical protein
MKIIWKDGYDRDTSSERLVAENIKYESEANVMLSALRYSVRQDESQWYVIVPDEHKIYIWEP